ncbi:hypothetical protein FBUS_02844 [Fasciolopsis buskii]|uniref:BZIP domain-containing protein n=1 Tax=Fasciolopsis buskii TaxID=27845 RepID=A0A8E0VFW7_9TREM|nr:hypothetical protein FBUS_02844 [Fasciolopsis buski]
MQGLYGSQAAHLGEFMGSGDSFRAGSFNSIPELALYQSSAGCIGDCSSTYSYGPPVHRVKLQCSPRMPNSVSPYHNQISNSFCFDPTVMSRNPGCGAVLSVANPMPLCDSTQIPFTNEPLATSRSLTTSTTAGRTRSRRRTRSGTQQHLRIEDSKSQDSPLSLSTKSKLGSSEDDSKGAISPCSSSEVHSNTKDDRYLQRRMRNNLAAKRSRDNRKRREDTIAMRASYLEKSNLVLQAQILALKREICMLRGIPFDPNYRARMSETNVTSPEPMAPGFFTSEITNPAAVTLTSSCTLEPATLQTATFMNDMFAEHSVLGQR